MKRNPTGGDRGPSGLVSARTAPSLHVRLDNRVRRSSHHAVVPFGGGRLGPQSAAPIAAGLPTPSGSGQRSLGRGPPDLEAADLADGDLVLDYGAMARQANFMTIGRPGIGKFERVELRLDPYWELQWSRMYSCQDWWH
jgi:hypothetical protein